MSEWNERTYEVHARYISAAYLIDTDEREHDAAELCAVVASVREIAVKVLAGEAS